MEDTYYALVYQCGIANVYRCPGRIRILQCDFRGAELFCAGLRCAGLKVLTYHCDRPGDAKGGDWEVGAGELFIERKCPPVVWVPDANN